MCGEQISPGALQLNIEGSPPRVRGTAILGDPDAAEGGITPACAGNRVFCVSFRSHAEDHPRVCGEQKSMIACVSMYCGSPPRVRGTALNQSYYFIVFGITPACAGNRLSAILDKLQGGDHPRVCGEQTIRRKRQLHGEGSPPRVRGTAALRSGMPACRRITPACAGNSRVV